jgi:hypothetical protein
MQEIPAVNLQTVNSISIRLSKIVYSYLGILVSYSRNFAPTESRKTYKNIVGPGLEDNFKRRIYFVLPFYLQSVLVHSANYVKAYTLECRRVLTRTTL